MNRTRPRKVDPLREHSDFQCALHAEFGMSTKFIHESTGLTMSQVSYRVKKFGIKRSNYRNGTGLAARAMLQHGRQMVGYHLERQLRDRLNPS